MILNGLSRLNLSMPIISVAEPRLLRLLPPGVPAFERYLPACLEQTRHNTISCLGNGLNNGRGNLQINDDVRRCQIRVSLRRFTRM